MPVVLQGQDAEAAVNATVKYKKGGCRRKDLCDSRSQDTKEEENETGT
jgi:hypothetical protein